MNTVRAGVVGENRVQILQLAGLLDAVIAIVGEYPEPRTDDDRFDQFLLHVLADPQAASGRLPADQYQFQVEKPSIEAYYMVELFAREHLERTKEHWSCNHRCTHAPLPSLFPNLNWTFDKGCGSYDLRKLQFGHTSDLDVSPPAPDSAPEFGYEAALRRLKVVVGEAVSHGLRNLRIVVSAANPYTLPPHRFSDLSVWVQEVLINRCMQTCYEIAGHADLELRSVDSLRKFIGPTSSDRNHSFEDHAIPQW